MTDEDRIDEGAEEAIKDLEAPATTHGDVVGGVVMCAQTTCAGSNVGTFCAQGMCNATKAAGEDDTKSVVLYARKTTR